MVCGQSVGATAYWCVHWGKPNSESVSQFPVFASMWRMRRRDKSLGNLFLWPLWWSGDGAEALGATGGVLALRVFGWGLGMEACSSSCSPFYPANPKHPLHGVPHLSQHFSGSHLFKFAFEYVWNSHWNLNRLNGHPYLEKRHKGLMVKKEVRIENLVNIILKFWWGAAMIDTSNWNQKWYW